MSNADTSIDHLDHDDQVVDGRTGELLPPLARDVSPAIAAEINQQVATARRFPRRRDRAIADEITGRATLNEDIASECQYSLKRGSGNDSKLILGPSIRFAEIVRASFGNIRVAARFVRLDTDDPKRAAVIVEAMALDLETNNAECIPVRRNVMTSGKGGRAPTIFSADMINTTVMAATAIARRNAILAVVPKAVWIEGYQRVVKVLQGDANTLSKRRADIIEAFKRINVEPARVFAALGVKGIDDITIEHMPTLVGFMTAIKEGETADAVLGRATDGEAEFDRVENPLREQGRGATAEQAEADAKGDKITTGPQNNETVQDIREGRGPKVKGDKQQAEPEQQKPAAAAAPTTRAEYLEYATGPNGWITNAILADGTEASSIEQLEKRLKDERSMRNGIANKDGNFNEEQLASLKRAIQAKAPEFAT